MNDDDLCAELRRVVQDPTATSGSRQLAQEFLAWLAKSGDRCRTELSSVETELAVLTH
jgi:hypothetical protein